MAPPIQIRWTQVTATQILIKDLHWWPNWHILRTMWEWLWSCFRQGLHQMANIAPPRCPAAACRFYFLPWLGSCPTQASVNEDIHSNSSPEHPDDAGDYMIENLTNLWSTSSFATDVCLIQQEAATPENSSILPTKWVHFKESGELNKSFLGTIRLPGMSWWQCSIEEGIKPLCYQSIDQWTVLEEKARKKREEDEAKERRKQEWEEKT